VVNYSRNQWTDCYWEEYHQEEADCHFLTTTTLTRNKDLLYHYNREEGKGIEKQRMLLVHQIIDIYLEQGEIVDHPIILRHHCRKKNRLDDSLVVVNRHC